MDVAKEIPKESYLLMPVWQRRLKVMKKMIDGVTYNTETSVLLGRGNQQVDSKDEGGRLHGELYRTSNGEYFLYIKVESVLSLGTRGTEIWAENPNNR